MDPVRKCKLCNSEFNSEEEFKVHRSTRKHLIEFLKYYYLKHQANLQEDKHNVSVRWLESSEPTSFITMRAEVSSACTATIRVSLAEAASKPVVIQASELLYSFNELRVTDAYKVAEGQKAVRLYPGRSYDFLVTFTPDNMCSFNVPLAFQFMESDSDLPPFHILRIINCSSLSSTFHEPQGATEGVEEDAEIAGLIVADVQKLVRNHNKVSEENPLNLLEAEEQLRFYAVPKELKKVQEYGLQNMSRVSEGDINFVRNIRTLLKEPLAQSTYWSRFSTLLYLEEIQMQKDIRSYDMKNADVKKSNSHRGCYELKVPGLAEKRPSVLRRDRVFLRILQNGGVQNIEYEGVVLHVKDSIVILNMPNKFNEVFINGMKFYARFTFNRMPLRLMHRALQSCEDRLLWHLIFPKSDTSAAALLGLPTNLVLYNRLIEQNEEQYAAIKNIVLGCHRPSPYLIFGPPGTGKTVTVVEAVKQVWKLIPASRILVTAPSNSACDLLVLQLLSHIPAAQVFRMYAASHDSRSIPEKILEKKCSNFNTAKSDFCFPPKKELMKYRIIVTTLVSAGRLVSAKFPDNHFSHIFVDEAGYSLEPECIVPVSGLFGNWNKNLRGVGCHFILVGDPKQLGPVIRSRFAKSFDLDVSYLERLMNKCSVYQRNEAGSFNQKYVTMLLKNYRSHPAILKLPSEMFYHNELQVSADERMRNSLCQWEKLPKKNFPVIFHGVLGKDAKDASSPSFYNMEEVSVVMDYVQSLLRGRGIGVTVREEDIGIISPYRRQVVKIRERCVSKNWKNVKIGSTEEFQGQEKLVVIISCVRSNPDFLSLDYMHRIGFLKNPKRFNVAVTRSKALLIVVGNPKTLSFDTCWKRFYEYCVENEAHIGFKYAEDVHIKRIEDGFQRIKLVTEELTEEDKKVFDGAMMISQTTLQEEPAWRMGC